MAKPRARAAVAPAPPTAHQIPASRVHGLSNGVFAIVVTLLVLELQVPEVAGTLGHAAHVQEVSQALAELLPRLIIFFVTFVVAGVSWLSQTRFQARFSHVDPRLAFLNIIYLMFVSLLPFTSARIGSFGDTPTGLASYALNQVLIGLAFLWMLWHAVRHGLIALLAVTAPLLAFFAPFVLLAAHPLLSRARGPGW